MALVEELGAELGADNVDDYKLLCSTIQSIDEHHKKKTDKNDNIGSLIEALRRECGDW